MPFVLPYYFLFHTLHKQESLEGVAASGTLRWRVVLLRRSTPSRLSTFAATYRLFQGRHLGRLLHPSFLVKSNGSEGLVRFANLYLRAEGK